MRVYGGKYVLNLPGHHGTAAVCAEVYFDDGDEVWYTDLRVSDCSRAVTLEFYGPGATMEQHENDLHKIDTLLTALRDFRTGLRRAHRQACR